MTGKPAASSTTTADSAPATRLERAAAILDESPLIATLYYVAILLGLLLLYGHGDQPTTGFIYQAF